MNMRRILVIILAVIPLVLPAGEEKKPDTWEPFQVFIVLRKTGTVRKNYNNSTDGSMEKIREWAGGKLTVEFEKFLPVPFPPVNEKGTGEFPLA